jgi:hypothetical protein
MVDVEEAMTTPALFTSTKRESGTMHGGRG